MNKFLALTRVLLVSGSTPFTKNKASKIKGIFLYIILAIVFLPIEISIGAFSGVVYDAMKRINQEGMILVLTFTISCIIVLVFGILYVLSVFYFSKDIESLLPLPLNPMEILASKFSVTLIYEYLIELLFLVPILIVYGIKSGGGIAYYALSIIMFFTLPVIPLVIASVLAMILMRFTNIGKNKDRFKVISSMVLVVGVFGFNIYINKISASNSSPEQIQSLLSQGNNSLIVVVTTIFINAKIAALSMINLGSLKCFANLGIYLAMTLCSFLLFLLLAQGLYFKGVIGLNQSVTKHKKLTSDILEKGTISSSATKAIFIKELKLLFRTPIYFINCVLMNFLWPIFILFPIAIKPGGINEIKKLSLNFSNSASSGIAIAVFFAVSVIITALNFITSTSISREGQNVFFMKYIPISYKKQINAKMLSGILMSTIAVTLMLIVSIILIKPDLSLIIIAVLVSALGIIFASETGMLIDLYYPKLVWDNEQKAVKQNLNTIVNMVLCFVFSGITIFIVIKFNLQLISVVLFIIILFGLLDYILYFLLMTLGINQLKKLE
ncbi:MAG: hypothetical protein H7Y18_17815 [Clostridiaceae bacterium]|nr:hypothetical protein [Clostridiaceae bacterium]